MEVREEDENARAGVGEDREIVEDGAAEVKAGVEVKGAVGVESMDSNES